MESDLSHRRSSYFSGCMSSPSCFPVHEELEYSRIHCCSHNKRSRRWRNLLRSYSQNFDEGCHNNEVPARHSKLRFIVQYDLINEKPLPILMPPGTMADTSPGTVFLLAAM
ncbi:hypothetical protein CFP56_000982 [Quercus suber]|uniref:Uncharacterized protein n=1 Tax=Quercus suber TaxID=58331 RepID=A0AAW0LIT6_QUESU